MEQVLQTSGDRIVRADGSAVLLRGVGVGGWLNMENFVTGFPSTETLQRRALAEVLGHEASKRFFARLLEVFFAEEDAALLASLGLNCVRIPVNYRHFEDDLSPFELKEEGFALLDRAIDVCARSGLYAIIDLHAVPGSQNQMWHSDNPTHRALFWEHRHFQDRVVHLWEALAGRYRGNPWVAGYNPVNEPADPSGEAIGPFYRRLHDAVRSIDEEHILFLDGNRYALDFTSFTETWPNTVWSAHDYALPGFYGGGDYPGESFGQLFDRDAVEATFLERTSFMRETGTPIWIGEFGPVYTGDARRDAMRYQLLADQLEIYDRYSAGWSLWTYKDIGLQGLVPVDPSSEYLQRIAPVIRKKARLGADAWGSTDAGVRHLLAPIHRTFAQEFPRFDPFPFGRHSWIETLIRHILLAEPLVDDYARCFEGLSAEEAESLADAFRLDRCLRHDALLRLLSSSAS